MIVRVLNQNTHRKVCVIATLSTTNSLLTDLGLSLYLCGERPAANCMREGTNSKEYLEAAFQVQKQHRRAYCCCIIISKLTTCTCGCKYKSVLRTENKNN